MNSKKKELSILNKIILFILTFSELLLYFLYKFLLNPLVPQVLQMFDFMLLDRILSKLTVTKYKHTHTHKFNCFALQIHLQFGLSSCGTRPTDPLLNANLWLGFLATRSVNVNQTIANKSNSELLNYFENVSI